MITVVSLTKPYTNVVFGEDLKLLGYEIRDMKTRRLLTEEELDRFLELRETKGDRAAAKYMAELQPKLYEEGKIVIVKKKV